VRQRRLGRQAWKGRNYLRMYFVRCGPPARRLAGCTVLSAAQVRHRQPSHSAGLGVSHFRLQSGKDFFLYIPLFKNRKYGSRPKTDPGERAENASCLFIVLGFLQPFSAEIFASLSLLVYFVVSGRNSLLDHISMDALCPQVRSNPHCAEFFVIPAVRGI